MDPWPWSLMFSAALVALCFGGLVCARVRNMERHGTSVLSLVADVRGAFGLPCGRSKENDPRAVQAACAAVHTRRKDCAIRCMSVISWLSPLMALLMIVFAPHMLLVGQDLALAATCAVMSLWSVWPPTSSRACDLYYSLLMAILVAATAACALGSAEHAMSFGAHSAMISLIVATVSLNYPVLCLWNALQFAVQLYAYYESSRNSDGTFSFQDLSLHETAVFVEKLVVLFVVQRALFGGVDCEAGHVAIRNKCDALASVLDLMCDAVVELDPKLTMVNHHPSLANLLLHGVGKSLQGLPLQDFIPPGPDFNMFEYFIGSSPPSQSGACQASLFKARVKDSMGNHVRMQFFHAPYLSVGGRVHHLIALSEHIDHRMNKTMSDETGIGSDLGSASMMSLGSDTLWMSNSNCEQEDLGQVEEEVQSPGRSDSHLKEAKEDHSWGNSSASSARSSKSIDSAGSGASAADTLCQVDVWAAEDLKINFASAEFQTKFGAAPPGASFAENFLQENDVFASWVATCATKILNGEASPRVENYGTLLIRPKSGGAKLRLIMVCFPDPATQTKANRAGATNGDYVVSLSLKSSRRRNSQSQSSGASGTASSGGYLRGTSAIAARHNLR